MTKLNWALACGVVLGALLAAAGPVQTADFRVHSGETVYTTQTLSDPGDVGLIEAGGAISTVDGPGVYMGPGVDKSVTNNGVITTSGIFNVGILSEGATLR